MAPAYQRQAIVVPEDFKEAGPWASARPSEAVPRGPWWRVFGDPDLDRLEAQAAEANPTLAAATAAYAQARALAAQAQAGLLPDIQGAAAATRQRRSDNAPLRAQGANGEASGVGEYSNRQLGAALAWELDLWGRLRNVAAASGAQAEASASDLESVRLSLQAELANTYMLLRGLDAQHALLTDTVEAFQRAQDLTQARHDGGAASGLDLGRARTQLSTAKAQLTDIEAQRALYEHAIAALVGQPASAFSLPPKVVAIAQPRLPVGQPSTLLERRPDIAAAERRAAAANAQIGVARAARFPSLTLNANAGWQTAGGVDLIAQPNSYWLLGPQLAGSIFDFGRRAANVRAARAVFDQASANYRAVVLSALRGVEDQMALANRLAAEQADQDAAVAAARETERLALIRYRQGASAYLEVVTAQTARLTAERAALSLATRRLQASVDLVRQLGGGWGPPAAVASNP
jgi:NodT family efflux transporter outer membrane factor (OMF) lipoprotein